MFNLKWFIFLYNISCCMFRNKSLMELKSTWTPLVLLISVCLKLNGQSIASASSVVYSPTPTGLHSIFQDNSTQKNFHLVAMVNEVYIIRCINKAELCVYYQLYLYICLYSNFKILKMVFVWKVSGGSEKIEEFDRPFDWTWGRCSSHPRLVLPSIQIWVRITYYKKIT